MGRPLGSVNKDKRFKAALVRFVDADPTRLDALAGILWDKATSGDVNAIREVADRLDGKVPQAIVGDDDHPPVIGVMTVNIVDPKASQNVGQD